MVYPRKYFFFLSVSDSPSKYICIMKYRLYLNFEPFICSLFRSCIDNTFTPHTITESYIWCPVKEFINFIGFIGKRNLRAGEQPSLKTELWTLKDKRHPVNRGSEQNKEWNKFSYKLIQCDRVDWGKILLKLYY